MQKINNSTKYINKDVHLEKQYMILKWQLIAGKTANVTL